MRTRHHHRSAILAVILAALIALTGFAFFSARGVKAVNIAYNQNTGTDGDVSTKTIKGNSGETIEQLLRDNGYAIDRDKYDYSVNLKKKVGEISGITITKKAKGTVTIDGKTVKFSSAEKTVGDMLKAIGVKVGSEDIVTPSTDTKLTTKISAVDVVRVTKTTVTNEQTLPYQTEIVASDNVSDGQAQVVTAGVSGTQSVTTQATYHNGVLTEETETTREVTKAPTTAQIAVSTADYQKTKETEAAQNSVASDTQADSQATDTTTDSTAIVKTATTSTITEDSSASEEKADASNTTDTDSSENQQATDNTATTDGAGEDANAVKVYTDSLNEGETKDITPTGSTVKMIAIGTKKVTLSSADEDSTEETDETSDVNDDAAEETVVKTSSTTSSSETQNTQSTQQSVSSDSGVTNSTASSETQQESSQATNNNSGASATATQTSNLSSYAAAEIAKGATTGHKTESVSSSDLDFICAMVAAEDNGSYKGALAVISCVMNRVDAGNWGGKTAVAVLKAEGQFSTYPTLYQKYSGGNYPDYVKAAVTDCLNGGLRNHNYTSFRANKLTSTKSVQIGGNWFANL